ncbi:phage holin family protein [Microbispora sp. ATCC PTA-5024]|uniref:phage holin family protein n=1 Tax=Microbispora sp. ATCC PTA-5024 TaxID=316330 RepID=UPI0003DD6D4B|nr:phage holin family protein [Microbispora sp. ATCC PTA-5024]ETK37212.1 hypothetical protein MPTA5024_05000 [Microbispora sp. ATCC PTA-5024]
MSHPAQDPEPSLGRLVGEIGEDLSTLFRQEVELAKAEIREEAGKAGRAAGLLGGAGFAGYMAALLATLAVMFGLGAWMSLGWAALIVAAVWGVVAAVLFVKGRERIREVDPVPQQTVETLKEDVRWARAQKR